MQQRHRQVLRQAKAGRRGPEAEPRVNMQGAAWVVGTLVATWATKQVVALATKQVVAWVSTPVVA